MRFSYPGRLFGTRFSGSGCTGATGSLRSQLLLASRPSRA